MATKKDKNNAILTAVRHPLRREILRRLDNTNGGMSPKGLANELNHPLGNTSHHVRVLVGVTVLKLVKIEPRRGANEHFYKRTGNAVDKTVTKVLEIIGKD